MQPPYRLYGAELSPYSQKLRAYLTYAGAPFTWINRSQARQEEFSRYAKLPLIPVLVDANDEALQDSTPTILALEAQAPVLTIDDSALAFLSALLEDYADEWLNKAMFHYRWSGAADAESAAERIVHGMFDGVAPENGAAVTGAVRERMIGRLKHVGSNATTGPVIEASFLRLIAQLEAHLEMRPYLFGARPSLADFGIACQLAQMLSDPTPGAILRDRGPLLLNWIDRVMTGSAASGPYESFDVLAMGLAPLLRDEIAGVYLPWMGANALAVARDDGQLSLTLDGRAFTQSPQRYAAKAYGELKRGRALAEDAKLAALLAETGCAPFLESDGAGAEDDDDDEGED